MQLHGACQGIVSHRVAGMANAAFVSLHPRHGVQRCGCGVDCQAHAAIAVTEGQQERAAVVQRLQAPDSKQVSKTSARQLGITIEGQLVTYMPMVTRAPRSRGTHPRTAYGNEGENAYRKLMYVKVKGSFA
jgi:hypothetical protein